MSDTSTTTDPDPFSSTPRDHPLPYTDKRGHADITVNCNGGFPDRPFLNDGEEGGSE